MRAVGVALALLLSTPALAGLTERDLRSVGVAPPPEAAVPTELRFEDVNGVALTLSDALGDHPALLLPVDYSCRTTCGPALTITASALARTGLNPGEDFRLIVVGIDPKDGPAAARAMTEARIGDESVARATRVLLGDEASTRALLDALGYRAAYDADADQFAHPTAAIALTAAGRVARVLSTLALDPDDLRLALTEAGEGGTGGLAARIALLCYGYDPVHGVYTLAIRRILAAAGAATVLALGAALVLMLRRARPKPEAP